MSHQTGITASEDLRAFFGESKDGNARLIKIAIKNEELVLDHWEEAVATWDEDYDTFVLPLLEDKQPCYIFLRQDTITDMGYQWIYIVWSPDHSPIKQKMLYAGTRATLKMEFGSGQICDEIFGTTVPDINLRGYHRHLASKSAPAPLTMAEEELEQIRRTEVNAEISVSSKNQLVSGISFPVSDEALEQLVCLRDGQVTYVQLSLDLSREIVNLEVSDDIKVSQLPSLVPDDSARYHVFRFKHTHEGDYMESIVFIYTMPGYKCPVKERMLYSSCKAPLIEGVLEQQLGMEIAKKIEVDSGSELTEDFIHEEIHPKKTIVKQKFAKPKGPGGRGPRRITKPSDNPVIS